MTDKMQLEFSKEALEVLGQWLDVSLALEHKTDAELAQILELAAADIEINHPVYGLLMEAAARLGPEEEDHE